MREPLVPIPRPAPARRPPSPAPVLLWTVPAVLLIAAAAIAYFLLRGGKGEQALDLEPEPPAAGIDAPAPALPAPRPEPQAAVPEPIAEPAVPLPALDDSDSELVGDLTESFGSDAITQYVVPKNLARNIVVTIDNLPRSSVALERRPLQPTPGTFVTRGPEEALYLSEDNYARYTPFVTLAASADADVVVRLYRRYYPLLQEAYVELGNPDTDFNQRVVEVIDHLLATPQIDEPLALRQPNVLYEYRDPQLEALSAGQKTLLRIGTENAGQLKQKLVEIRDRLTATD
jgi:Protein of unknown function (DUF3014)